MPPSNGFPPNSFPPNAWYCAPDRIIQRKLPCECGWGDCPRFLSQVLGLLHLQSSLHHSFVVLLSFSVDLKSLSAQHFLQTNQGLVRAKRYKIGITWVRRSVIPASFLSFLRPKWLLTFWWVLSLTLSLIYSVFRGLCFDSINKIFFRSFGSTSTFIAPSVGLSFALCLTKSSFSFLLRSSRGASSWLFFPKILDFLLLTRHSYVD